MNNALTSHFCSCTAGRSLGKLESMEGAIVLVEAEREARRGQIGELEAGVGITQLDDVCRLCLCLVGFHPA